MKVRAFCRQEDATDTQGWAAAKYTDSSIVLEFKFEVLSLYFSVFI